MSRSTLTRAGLAFAAVLAPMVVAAAPAQAAVGGTVDVATGATLSVRSAPNATATKVGSLADNATISITCKTTGTSVTGSQGTTSQWDKISSGYVSHAYVRSSGTIPGCSATPPPPPSSSGISAGIAWGKTQLGTRYVGCAGGTYRFGVAPTTNKSHDGRTCGQSRVYFQPAGTIGYDCSGLMYAVLKKSGINLAHTSSSSIKAYVPQVSKSSLRPGDMLAKNGHVVMYIGSYNGVNSVIESTPYAQNSDGSWVGTRIRSVSGFLSSTDYTAHRAPGL